MAITNATRLADFGTGIGTAGAVIEIDNTNERVGLGTTNPNTTVTIGPIGAAGTSLFVHGDARYTGMVTAASANFDGNISVGGTLTYNDVTNIDAVGMITARGGLRVTGTKNGINVASGIVTATSFSGSGANLTGISTAAVPGISTQLHSVFGTVNASGIVTASAFKGDGSTLTGVGGDTDITSCLFI